MGNLETIDHETITVGWILPSMVKNFPSGERQSPRDDGQMFESMNEMGSSLWSFETEVYCRHVSCDDSRMLESDLNQLGNHFRLDAAGQIRVRLGTRHSQSGNT